MHVCSGPGAVRPRGCRAVLVRVRAAARRNVCLSLGRLMPRRLLPHFSFSRVNQGVSERLCGHQLPFAAGLCGAPAGPCQTAAGADGRRAVRTEGGACRSLRCCAVTGLCVSQVTVTEFA